MAVTGTQEPLWFTASNWDADFHQIVERMVSTPLEQLLREGEAMGLGASDLDRLRRKKLQIAGLSVEEARAALGESREIGLRQITTTLSMIRALRQIEAIYDGSLERRDTSGGPVIQAAPPDSEVARWVGISILRTRNLLIGSSQLLLSYAPELRDPALVGMFQDAARLLPKLGPRLKRAIETHALPPRPVGVAGQNAIEPLSLAVRIAEAGWSSICQARDPMSAALAIERELNCTEPPVRESETFTGDEWFAGRMDSILRAVGEWPSIDYSGLIAMVEAYCLEAFGINAPRSGSHWPPDDGWHFLPGTYAFRSRQIKTLAGIPLKLLSFATAAKVPFKLTDADLVELVWEGSEPSGPGFRSTLTGLRNHLRKEWDLRSDDDPLPCRDGAYTFNHELFNGLSAR